MGDDDISGKRGRLKGEAVVLAGDGDFARGGILNRVVRAVVAELEFESAAAQGLPQNLVPEADAGDGHLAEKLFDVLDDVAERRRVAGAVREKYGCWIPRQNTLGALEGGHDLKVEEPR